MIITLITIGIFIISIVCIVMESKWYRCPIWVELIGMIMVAISIVAGLIIGSCILDAQINGDITYQNKLHERQMLEYRIDKIEDNIIGNEKLYNDIVVFNNSLRGTKKWANNPWTNWFHPESVATIDYIDISKKE